MDSFKEQIVRKLPTQNDKLQKIFIMIGSVALAALCFIFPFGTQFSVIGIFLAAAALYGGYYLITKLDVEYEYIFTNGEIDVDKITAQRSRKRLITFRCGAATDFGVADDNFEVEDGRTQVLACACNSELTDYYISFNHKNFGETTVIFTPDEDMLALIKPALPRTLRK
ncbi:DUF6106 family protein [Ruminococcus sp.]|uniref:DUF6106 family protein n=1 Tax=Ruminococcus sp. TaxID=41978 RepID=UPI0025D48C03|nr:DUF6106 family protein [Ruminococcus sp.]